VIWRAPADPVFPIAVILVVVSVYILISAFVPVLRWPRDR
jgi:hypothetical protein